MFVNVAYLERSQIYEHAINNCFACLQFSVLAKMPCIHCILLKFPLCQRRQTILLPKWTYIKFYSIKKSFFIDYQLVIFFFANFGT